MKEIVAGIYCLPLQPKPGLDYVNSYLVRGDDDYLLVDTAWCTDEAFDSFTAQLAEIGATVPEITSVVITHAHPDHLGLSGRLQKLTKANFAMHYLERDSMAPRYDLATFVPQMKEWFRQHGTPAEEIAALAETFYGVMAITEPAIPDVVFRGGEELTCGAFRFRVLWTPGHTPGHICLYAAEQKLLLAGDHVSQPAASASINLYPDYNATTLDEFLKSLDELGQLDIDLILPGHGDSFHGIRAWIEERQHYHEQKNTAILAQLASGAMTAHQLAAALTAPADWTSLAAFHKRRAILETLAHLASLHSNDRIAKSTRDGTVYYRMK